MTEAYIIDAVRTPRGIGKPGKGALAHLHPQHVAATVLKALRDRNGLDTRAVDDIIWSTSVQKWKQGSNIARMSALLAGYDLRASGVTLDRFCGGGLTATAFAAGQIRSEMEDILIAGGSEMLSYHQTASRIEVEAGIAPLGTHAGNPDLLELHPIATNGVAADAIAAMEGIGRGTLDAIGLLSQARAARAIREGRFDRSTVPVYNPDGALALEQEEFPRPDTTAVDLAGLKPAFAALRDTSILPDGTTFGQLIRRKYPGLDWDPVHHAGTSSGVVDGAAGLLLASEAACRRHGWTPRARIVASANAGDCPVLALNAPAPAARKVLAKAGLTTADIDLWEVNEAFAVVPEKFIRDLDLDRDRVNVNGGAIALGHPVGATGAILLGTALDELERTGRRYALVTMCAAGGMAPAVILERLG